MAAKLRVGSIRRLSRGHANARLARCPRYHEDPLTEPTAGVQPLSTGTRALPAIRTLLRPIRYRRVERTFGIELLRPREAARRRSRRGLGKFGQDVARVVPARGLGSPHVQLRSVGDRRVETPQPQQHVRLVRPIGDDMRAASGAKPPKLAGRRFEARQQLFAAQPAKRLPGHWHDRRKRGPMGLAAGRAMAMDDRARRSIDLVGDGTAKAATCQHDQTLYARIQRSGRGH
jgi:hypothetical protein